MFIGTCKVCGQVNTIDVQCSCAARLTTSIMDDIANSSLVSFNCEYCGEIHSKLFMCTAKATQMGFMGMVTTSIATNKRWSFIAWFKGLFK